MCFGGPEAAGSSSRGSRRRGGGERDPRPDDAGSAGAEGGLPVCLVVLLLPLAHVSGCAAPRTADGLGPAEGGVEWVGPAPRAWVGLASGRAALSGRGAPYGSGCPPKELDWRPGTRRPRRARALALRGGPPRARPPARGKGHLGAPGTGDTAPIATVKDVSTCRVHQRTGGLETDHLVLQFLKTTGISVFGPNFALVPVGPRDTGTPTRISGVEAWRGR